MRIEAHSMVLLAGVLYQPVCGIAQAGVADAHYAQYFDTTLVDSMHMGASLRELPSLPLSALTDSTRFQQWKAKVTKPKTTGTINLGAVHGLIPFTEPTASNWNGTVRGMMGTEVLGLPLSFSFDLGTDKPIRGQRNRFTVQFDASRAADIARWDGTRALHAARGQADSISRLKAETARRMHSLTTRLGVGENARVTSEGLPMPEGSREVRNMEPISIDGAAQDSGSVTSFGRGRIVELGDSASAQHDAWAVELAEATARYQHLDTLEKHYRAVELRAHAVVEATQGGALRDMLSKGIRKLQLGTCTPSGTEFLLNGVTYQGVGLELAHRGIFLAVDHGRSLDDRARDVDVAANSVRRLQQSLFLTDVRELVPERLTAIRVGAGAIEGTYLQLGYLHGTRTDVPEGELADMANTTTAANHVLELGGGLRIKHGHTLRFAYARSMVNTGASDAETGAPRRGVLDLVNGGLPQEEALLLRWTSAFDKLGTLLEAEARTVDQHFQSFGLGFVRNGSRSLGVRLDQHLTSKVRVKLRGLVEDRVLPSSETSQIVRIQRAQAMVNYRPNRVLTIHVHTTPVHTTGPFPSAPGNTTWACGAGFNVRQRWNKTTVSGQAELGAYAWRSGSDPVQRALNTNITLGVEQQQRWQAHAQWNQFHQMVLDTVPGATTLTLGLGWQLADRTRLDASVHSTDGGRWGYNTTVSQRIAERWKLLAGAVRYARLEPIGLGGIAPTGPAMNTWSTSLEYTW